MDTPFDRLVIPKHIADEMIVQAIAESPLECCGVLAGDIAERIGTVRKHFPVRNDLASPNRYVTNARDLLAVTKTTRAEGWEWLAIYHSHPTSAAVPSRIDLADNTYGLSVLHVILGRVDETPEVRGWWLDEDSFTEAVLDFNVGQIIPSA